MTDVDEKSRKLTDYKALAKRLSDALLTLRPFGGSEMFIRVGEDFFADPEYCKSIIEYDRDALHRARREAALAAKATHR